MSESPLVGDEAHAGGPPVRGAGLVAHVEPYEGAPDECTLYPAGLDDEDLVTNWISARADSYVALPAMR